MLGMHFSHTAICCACSSSRCVCTFDKTEVNDSKGLTIDQLMIDTMWLASQPSYYADW